MSSNAVAEIPKFSDKNWSDGKTAARPVLLLTIKNGAAHTRAAEAIAAARRKTSAEIPTRIVEVSAFMSRFARFTHVSAYLWLVKNAPRVWEKIDDYQKRQTQTSPEWFYRRECRKLFELVEKIQPSAIVSTEVGCGEIAALIKRDLKLKIPLVAVNLDYEADRAWIQPEVDLYCLATDLIEKDFQNFGASLDKIKIWGAPLSAKFKRLSEAERREKREKVCGQLEFNSDEPLILVAGGVEGLGKIEAVVKELLKLKTNIAVLCGRNERLKARCEKLGFESRLRVLGWTEKVFDLMQAADVLVSKLGLTFYEALACALPIVALEPPPGAERAQYNLLENFGTGRAVKTVAEMSKAVGELLDNKKSLQKMRAQTEVFGQTQAAAKLAEWLRENINV
ncbi:MAG: MGDG synthase family glycosyltransferase [Pyrinomonadaceae bacterium]